MATFTSIVVSEAEGPFQTFEEALINFWPRLTACYRGGCPGAELDLCWIEADFGDEDRVPLLWGVVNDFGAKNGLFTGEGNLKDPLPEINPKLVDAEYRQSRIDRIQSMIAETLR